MKIILAETHYWDSVAHVDSHHLARELGACGHAVLYLSSPVSPFHFLDGKSWGAKWARLWRYGGRGRTPTNFLRCIAPRTLAPVHTTRLLDSDRQLARSLRWTVPCLKRLIRRLGFAPPDALIIQSLFFAKLPDLVPGALVIYRMTDDFASFPGMPKALLRAEEELVRRANVVTASSYKLADRARAMGARRVEYLPHGVQYDLFNPSGAPPKPAMTMIPRAVYVGAIDSWFDARCVAVAAKALPSWRFDLAGPVSPAADLAPLEELHNVKLVGPVPHDQLPAFFDGAVIGMIPFLRTPLIEAVHPLKLYEYLAAGLAVVSTRWDEIERIGAPIRLAKDTYEFGSEMIEAASAPPPPEGRAFAMKHDWIERAQALESLIEETADAP